MVKKFFSILLAGTIIFSLSACGKTSTEENQNISSGDSMQTESESTSAESVSSDEAGDLTSDASESISSIPDEKEAVTGTPAEENTDEENGKTLVVYYSATGSTKAVANYIADAIGADLFEFEPVEPYTDEDLAGSNDESRVSREHNDESLRDVDLVSTTVDNFSDYDEILIGYPIWWGIAAWPVNQFIKNNDFTGKTVIPFCTSASSELGDSGKLLEEMAGTGNWQEGQRFSSSASEAEVQDWVKSLNLN